MTRTFILLGTLIVSTSSCSSSAGPEPETFPPVARIAVSALHGPIRLTTLTGESERTLISGNVNAQDWSPQNNKLVYVADRTSTVYGLRITDTMGVSVELPVPNNSTWPQYSKDGSWIYFFVQNNPFQSYRIHPDGTGLELLRDGSFPTPSPDGQRVAIATSGGVWVGKLATKEGSVLPGTNGAIVMRWSPDGKWIAYRQTGGIVLITPDGKTRRDLSAPGIGGLSWSPDSRWLLAGNGGALQLFDIKNQTQSELVVTGNYPSWKR